MILYPPKSKNNRNLIGKENMVDPKVFERLGPYEFLFLNKENKAKWKKNANLATWRDCSRNELGRAFSKI